MNKLRLIRIYELRKQIHPIEQSVIELLDSIDIILTEKFIEYSKDNIDYFTFILRTNNIHLSYQLENEFKDNFGCSYEETRVVLKYLLEKHLKIEINEVYLWIS